MGNTVADTIRETSRKHLEEDNGLLFGQCLQAVGFVGGTVPDVKVGLVELNTAEVSNTGVVVGSALMGRRPIYVIRYQGFMWLAANTLVNYAAKSKDVWNVPCPLFVRSIAMEGNGIGPTASGSQHGLLLRMPGIKICAPMTSNEWLACWQDFLDHDDPVYCSEHRRSFTIDYEIPDIINDKPVVTIFAISSARLNAIEAVKMLEKSGHKCNMFNIVNIKPFTIQPEYIDSINSSSISLVIDSDFEIGGASQSLSYDLMHASDKKVYAMGLEDRTGGVAINLDNLTPSPEKIIKFITEKLGTNFA